MSCVSLISTRLRATILCCPPLKVEARRLASAVTSGSMRRKGPNLSASLARQLRLRRCLRMKKGIQVLSQFDSPIKELSPLAIAILGVVPVAN